MGGGGVLLTCIPACSLSPTLCRRGRRGWARNHPQATPPPLFFPLGSCSLAVAAGAVIAEAAVAAANAVVAVAAVAVAVVVMTAMAAFICR
jgi:hypothetical protein